MLRISLFTDLGIAVEDEVMKAAQSWEWLEEK